MSGIGIAMMVVYVYAKIYIDRGGPGLTIYRPQCPPGFCILGDYAQGGDTSKPNHGAMLCVLMSDSKMVIRASGFNQIWSSEGPASGNDEFSGTFDDEEPDEESGTFTSGSDQILAFWEPVVPHSEYVALGHVVTTSYEPPNDVDICVVHKSVATPGIPGKRLWIQEARMASIWTLASSYHYILTGTFISSDSQVAPRLNQFWSLIPDVVPAPNNTSLSVKKLKRADLALIYRGQECRIDSQPLSVYLPQAPIGYVPLGHYAEQGFAPKDEEVNVLVVKEEGGRGLLRKPIAYQELWRTDGANNMTDAAIWRPVPSPGYFCLGHVLGLGSEPPPTNAMMCLHWSVVGRSPQSKRVWWNKCSLKRQATIWGVTGSNTCLTANTFVIHRGLHVPHWEEHLFHCFYQNEMPVK